MSMDCNKTQMLFNQLQDGELDEIEASSVRQHIASCSTCRISWNTELNLSNRFKSLFDSIQVPISGLENLSSTIERENTVAIQRPLSKAKFAAVAASLALLLATYLLLKVENASSPILPVSIDTIVLESEVAVLEHKNATAIDYRKLSSETGFEVIEKQFSGWRISSANVRVMPGTRTKAVYFTYTSASGKKIKLLQSRHKLIDTIGMNEHTIGGRLICCGLVNSMSVVYWPDKSCDNVLVGAVPQEDLMEIALKVRV